MYDRGTVPLDHLSVFFRDLLATEERPKDRFTYLGLDFGEAMAQIIAIRPIRTPDEVVFSTGFTLNLNEPRQLNEIEVEYHPVLAHDCVSPTLELAVTLSLAVLVGHTPIKSEPALERDRYHR